VSDQRRLLLVHAHPDDESITTGATIAKYAAEGAHVTLITCTRGEQGEVIPARLSHLAAGTAPGDDGVGDALGSHRVSELGAAMAELGVSDHRFLGDPHCPGRPVDEVIKVGGTVYRDSGMAYAADGSVVPSSNPPPLAFALADAEEAAELLAGQLRELRPQVVISYEPGGGYGHPDHVRAHMITMRAVELAKLAGSQASPAWAVPKVYWIVMPESLARATLSPDSAGRRPSMVVPDDQVTAAIDASSFTPAKIAALRAHETQVSVSTDGTSYALSNRIRQPVLGLEFYRLALGPAAGARDDVGREIDLFAGA
jgi:N-acetyl-1-D-myo-inositol-2-amino-2-deoxy-alpha-D-glucopyranoside deacetylase